MFPFNSDIDKKRSVHCSVNKRSVSTECQMSQTIGSQTVQQWNVRTHLIKCFSVNLKRQQIFIITLEKHAKTYQCKSAHIL